MLQRQHRLRDVAGSCGHQPSSLAANSTRWHQPRRCRTSVRGHCLTLERAAPLSTGLQCDVVLSSGFLAFAYHSGFLQAVEEAGVEVSGVMGTSAGAFAGALYCAGYSPRQVAAELSRDTPIDLLRCSLRSGFFSMEPVIDRLRDLLPPRFEDLETDFAVGVVTADGEHLVVDSGPLPEAVVASAAIPIIFEPVHIPGHERINNPFKDGGVVDRVGLKAWRERRRTQARAQGRDPAHVPPALVHVIARSSPFSGFDDVEAQQEPHVTIVHSPRSGVNFLSLGDFEAQLHASRERARPLLAQGLQAVRLQQPLVVSGGVTNAGPLPIPAGSVLAADAKLSGEASRLARTGL